MLVAGGILWANCRNAPPDWVSHHVRHAELGWPCLIAEDFFFEAHNEEMQADGIYEDGWQWRDHALLNIAIDASCLFSITLAAIIVCEYLARRRAFPLSLHFVSKFVLLFMTAAMLFAELRECDCEWGFESDAYTPHGFPAASVITYDYEDMAIPVEKRVRYQFNTDTDYYYGHYTWELITPAVSVVVVPLDLLLDAALAFSIVANGILLCEALIRWRSLEKAHAFA